MADQAAHLSSTLHTGRVPIPRFKEGEISPNGWIRAESQLKAALIGQGCTGAWSSTPCVTDPDAADAALNTRGADDRALITQHNSARIIDRIILTKQAINRRHQSLLHRRMAKRETMGHLQETPEKIQAFRQGRTATTHGSNGSNCNRRKR